MIARFSLASRLLPKSASPPRRPAVARRDARAYSPDPGRIGFFTHPPGGATNPSVFRPPVILLALIAAPSLFAEPAEKPAGRSIQQRFGSIDQGLVFDPRQGAVGQGQTFSTRNAPSGEFYYDQKIAPSKYETREFAPKTSWLSKLKFWTKDANTGGTGEIPNASRQFGTKSAAVKESRDAGKTMAVRDLPGGDRVYLGPERAKLDRSVDPTKPLPGWTGNKMEVLTLEQVRELLNKNK